MKSNMIIAAAMMAAAVVSCGSPAGKAGKGGDADSLAIVKPAKISKAEVDSASYLLGVNIGNFLKGYGFADKSLSELNMSEFKKGIADFIGNDLQPMDSNYLKQFKINPEKMNDVFNGYLEKKHAIKVYEAKEAEKAYLATVAKNAAKDGLTKTDSGLWYKIEEAGAADKIGPKDTVYAHYTGTLTNGNKFDGTDPEQPSSKFTLNRVIKGWTEGLQLIGEGGKIHLIIPSELGYGEQGNRSIPASATLIFDVQVDSVRHFEPVKEEK